MKQILCLRSEELAVRCDDYLKQLASEININIKLVGWEDQREINQWPLILLVDQNQLPYLMEILIKREQKVIIALNSRRDFKIISDLKNHLSNIFGFIDISQDKEYNIPLLKNYLNSLYPESHSILHQLANDLEKIFEYTKSELTRVKDLHEKFVKMRKDQFKTISLTSKFMAGEKSGGEFFDVLQNEQGVVYLQVGTDSYVLTSIILGELEKLKEKAPGADLEKLLEDFKKMLNFNAREQGSTLSYCLCSINFKTLQAKVESLGNGCLYSDGEIIKPQGSLLLKLRPSQKVSFISEGAIKNLEFLNPGLELQAFFNTNKEASTNDVITEFFYELSRHKSGSFLIYDAYMGTFEIEANALYQI